VVLYLFGSFFFSFLGMMNDGGLLLPREPGFHPSALPFAPPPDRAVPCFPDPSIVWNSFTILVLHANMILAYTFIHNIIVAYITDYMPDKVAGISIILAWGLGHLRANK